MRAFGTESVHLLSWILADANETSVKNRVISINARVEKIARDTSAIYKPICYVSLHAFIALLNDLRLSA